MYKENGYEKRQTIDMDGKEKTEEVIKISRMTFHKESREEYDAKKDTDRMKHFFEGNQSEPC